MKQTFKYFAVISMKGRINQQDICKQHIGIDEPIYHFVLVDQPARDIKYRSVHGNYLSVVY